MVRVHSRLPKSVVESRAWRFRQALCLWWYEKTTKNRPRCGPRELFPRWAKVLEPFRACQSSQGSAREQPLTLCPCGPDSGPHEASTACTRGASRASRSGRSARRSTNSPTTSASTAFSSRSSCTPPTRHQAHPNVHLSVKAESLAASAIERQDGHRHTPGLTCGVLAMCSGAGSGPLIEVRVSACLAASVRWDIKWRAHRVQASDTDNARASALRSR